MRSVDSLGLSWPSLSQGQGLHGAAVDPVQMSSLWPSETEQHKQGWMFVEGCLLGTGESSQSRVLREASTTLCNLWVEKNVGWFCCLFQMLLFPLSSISANADETLSSGGQSQTWWKNPGGDAHGCLSLGVQCPLVAGAPSIQTTALVQVFWLKGCSWGFHRPVGCPAPLWKLEI